MAKYRLIGIIVGIVFVVFMMGTAPFVLSAIDWVTDDTPTVAEACDHIRTTMDFEWSDCEEQIQADHDEYKPEQQRRFLQCLGDVMDRHELDQCNDYVYVFSYERRTREREREKRGVAAP